MTLHEIEKIKKVLKSGNKFDMYWPVALHNALSALDELPKVKKELEEMKRDSLVHRCEMQQKEIAELKKGIITNQVCPSNCTILKDRDRLQGIVNGLPSEEELISILHEASTFTYQHKDYLAPQKICFLLTEEIRKAVATVISQRIGQVECQHISGGLGACPKCMKPYDEINGTGPHKHNFVYVQDKLAIAIEALEEIKNIKCGWCSHNYLAQQALDRIRKE